MASVRYDAKQGAWIVDYYYRAPDGRRLRRREQIPVADAEEAAVWLEGWQRRRGPESVAADAAGTRIHRDPTIAELARWYVDELQVARGDAESTRAGNRQMFGLFVAWMRGQGVERASQLQARPHLLDSYLAYLLRDYAHGPHVPPRKGVAVGTARTHLSKIKALFVAAHRRKLVPDTPCADWPMPRAPEAGAADDTITADELAALLAWFRDRGHPLRNVITYLAYVGCRPSDAVALRWEHVDLERRRVTFTQRKTGRTVRVPLTAPVLAALAEERLRHASTGLVFRGNTEERLTVGAIKSAMQWACKQIGCRRITPRHLRQFVVTDLLEAGTDRDHIRLITGHTSNAIRAYEKRRQDRAREAAEAFAARRQREHGQRRQ
jgi:integrase